MPRTDKAEIVPFGKYKGQPVETLLADQSYCEWAMAQPWFKERFGNVYNVIVNYGGEPADTPEHNEMQARFLDDEWCLKTVGALGMAYDLETVKTRIASGKFNPVLAGLMDSAEGPASIKERSFEARGWDVVFVFHPAGVNFYLGEDPVCTCAECDHEKDCDPLSCCHHKTDGANWNCVHSDCARRSKDFWPRVYADCKSYDDRNAEEFAKQHCDNSCSWSDKGNVKRLLRFRRDGMGFSSIGDGRSVHEDDGLHILVECKPSLGDDYPVVLRQVTRYPTDGYTNPKRCVVARRAEFSSVTWGQVVKIFAASNIALVREPEIPTDDETLSAMPF